MHEQTPVNIDGIQSRRHWLRSATTLSAGVAVGFSLDKLQAEASPEDKRIIEEAKGQLEGINSFLQGLPVFEECAKNVDIEIACVFVEDKFNAGVGKWFFLTDLENSSAEEVYVNFDDLQKYLESTSSEKVGDIRFIHSHPVKVSGEKTDIGFRKNNQQFDSVHMIPSINDFNMLLAKMVALPKLADNMEEFIFFEGNEYYINFSVDNNNEFVSKILKATTPNEASEIFDRLLVEDRDFCDAIVAFDRNLQDGDSKAVSIYLEKMLAGFEKRGLKFEIISKREMVR